MSFFIDDGDWCLVYIHPIVAVAVAVAVTGVVALVVYVGLVYR